MPSGANPSRRARTSSSSIAFERVGVSIERMYSIQVGSTSGFGLMDGHHTTRPPNGQIPGHFQADTLRRTSHAHDDAHLSAAALLSSAGMISFFSGFSSAAAIVSK